LNLVELNNYLEFKEMSNIPAETAETPVAAPAATTPTPSIPETHEIEEVPSDAESVESQEEVVEVKADAPAKKRGPARKTTKTAVVPKTIVCKRHKTCDKTTCVYLHKGDEGFDEAFKKLKAKLAAKPEAKSDAKSDAKSADCKVVMDGKECKFGAKCRFRHEGDVGFGNGKKKVTARPTTAKHKPTQSEKANNLAAAAAMESQVLPMFAAYMKLMGANKDTLMQMMVVDVHKKLLPFMGGNGGALE
jgi:hypothetical protein